MKQLTVRKDPRSWGLWVEVATIHEHEDTRRVLDAAPALFHFAEVVSTAENKFSARENAETLHTLKTLAAELVARVNGTGK
jgi:predicted RNA binding protein with dsRBD fold (UPF0201 family)